MKKLIMLTITAAILAGYSFAEEAKVDSQEPLKISSLEKSATANAWYALSGTQKLTEVQFLETILDTEYLEQARAHEKKYHEDAGASSLIFLGSVASGAVGLIVTVAGTLTRKPELLAGGLIAGLAAIPLSIWSAVAAPWEMNLLSADQAQVLADRYNGKQ